MSYYNRCLKCDMCSQTFNGSDVYKELEQHALITHFMCHKCGERFTDKLLEEKHQWIEHPNPNDEYVKAWNEARKNGFRREDGSYMNSFYHDDPYY